MASNKEKKLPPLRVSLLRRVQKNVQLRMKKTQKHMPSSSRFRQTVLRALCYADVFHFPLRFSEIERYCQWLLPVSTEIDVPVRSALVALKKQKRVLWLKEHDLFCLRGRSSLFQKRMQQTTWIYERMPKARWAARFLSHLPTIDGVFLTGSLAAGSTTRYDDIDFLIVTKRGWLWTTRFFVVLFAKLFGFYRPRGARNETHAVNNKWCLNIWVDESSLTVPEQLQSVYAAHELFYCLPLYGKQQIYARYLHANMWIKRFFPNVFRIIPVSTEQSRRKQQQNEISILERFFFFIQQRNMKHHQTNEIVTKTYAFFHPQSLVEPIRQQFYQRLRAHRLSVK